MKSHSLTSRGAGLNEIDKELADFDVNIPFRSAPSESLPRLLKMGWVYYQIGPGGWGSRWHEFYHSAYPDCILAFDASGFVEGQDDYRNEKFESWLLEHYHPDAWMKPRNSWKNFCEFYAIGSSLDELQEFMSYWNPKEWHRTRRPQCEQMCKEIKERWRTGVDVNQLPIPERRRPMGKVFRRVG